MEISKKKKMMMMNSAGVKR
ncbi:hypothetical protein CCACVL1_00674 [Corchorus capsularis]|uniref:Uncharacterized protein n=1 Tax=Corchorus capsularis TaxID=210143 RepID=A0A1R3KVL4_COCAP|nr:hypothetical protein CCACVL1_00674 [Corchorus capsularis]